LAAPHKICPICQTPNHRNASICSTCGKTLGNVSAAGDQPQTPRAVETLSYDYRHGETDLFEGDLHRTGQAYLRGLLVLLVLVMLGGLVLALGPTLLDSVSSSDTNNRSNNNAADSSGGRAPVTLPTVTPAPPSATAPPTIEPTEVPQPTATPEPCMQEVLTTDTGLYDVVLRCGHVSMNVIPLVAEINNLDNINLIRPGQVLEIPWPTSTPAPDAPAEAPAEADDEASADDGDAVAASQPGAFDEDFDPLFVPTATLPPGIMFHTVQRDENIIVIGMQYDASVEVLSQLNPEITFSQCEFGQRFGGPRCTVQLRENQLIRVPAPTAEPTLSPTPSGSETPTLTPTATFNAPVQQSPSDRAFFDRDDLITLRWVPTGTLGADQVYRLRVEDTTAGVVYTTTTRDTSFVVPEDWQGEGESNRHNYAWSVSVINLTDPDNPQYTTETLTFTWESR